MNTSFADTILNINVTGMLVRIDFGTVVKSINPQGQEETRTTITQQLVMPMEGFAQSFTLLDRMVNQLVAQGVLKKEPQNTTPIPPSHSGPVTLQ